MSTAGRRSDPEFALAAGIFGRLDGVSALPACEGQDVAAFEYARDGARLELKLVARGDASALFIATLPNSAQVWTSKEMNEMAGQNFFAVGFVGLSPETGDLSFSKRISLATLCASQASLLVSEASQRLMETISKLGTLAPIDTQPDFAMFSLRA